MQLVPRELVPVAQSLIAKQGYNPYLIDANGNLDAGGVLGVFFNEVEVRTTVTPPLKFPITATGPSPDPMMQEVLESLRPTVIFTGPAGREVIAPFGETSGASSWLPVALVGGAIVLGIGYLLWD